MALDHVNLTVADSEFVVLVGPSGCGKSTLLRIIAGLEDATGGSVAIDGRTVDDLSPRNATSPWSSRTTPSTRT